MNTRVWRGVLYSKTSCSSIRRLGLGRRRPRPPVGATRAGRAAGGTSADVQADNIFEIAEKHDPMARFGVETAQNRPKLR